MTVEGALIVVAVVIGGGLLLGFMDRSRRGRGRRR